mgnify:CR=1 FL=1
MNKFQKIIYISKRSFSKQVKQMDTVNAEGGFKFPYKMQREHTEERQKFRS